MVVYGHVRVQGGSEKVAIKHVKEVTRYDRENKDGGHSYTFGIKGTGMFDGKSRNLAAFVKEAEAKKIAKDNDMSIKTKKVERSGARKSCKQKCEERCESRSAKAKAKRPTARKQSGSTSTSKVAKKLEKAVESIQDASSSLKEASQSISSISKQAKPKKRASPKKRAAPKKKSASPKKKGVRGRPKKAE
jgi:hypothetical protein